MTHTATPWTLTHIEGSNFAVQEFEIRGMFGDKQDVTPIFNKDRYSIDEESVFVSPDDAAFIVRAVNAHDDLVKIAEALVHKSEFNGGVWPSWMPFDEEHCRKLIAGTV